MEILRTPQALQTALNQHSDKRVGFVPTMGYFHEGHLSLMERATEENDISVASIFVNPLQFGPSEDFERYPRDEERDAALAENVGIDYLFIPTVETMYPRQLNVTMHMTSRTDVLCGMSRPGHFDGVITVLAKLFNIVQPTKAYFGLKDAQQFAVVQAFVEDLNFPLELVGVPTIREADGLAKSSRNVFLSEHERQQAPWIYKALQEGKALAESNSDNASVVLEHVKEMINTNTTGTIDYVELLRYPELTPVEKLQGKLILAAAVQFSKARLIDNLIFDLDSK